MEFDMVDVYRGKSSLTDVVVLDRGVLVSKWRVTAIITTVPLASHADIDAPIISVTSHGAVSVHNGVLHSRFLDESRSCSRIVCSLQAFCVRLERVEQPVCFEYMCGVKSRHEHDLSSTVDVPSPSFRNSSWAAQQRRRGLAAHLGGWVRRSLRMQQYFRKEVECARWIFIVQLQFDEEFRTGCHSRTTHSRMKALRSLVLFSPFQFTFCFFAYIVRNVNYKLCDDCNPAETLVGTLTVNSALEPSCHVVVVDVFARRDGSVRDGGGIVPWRSCSVSGQASSFGHGIPGLQSTFEEVAKRFNVVRSKWYGGFVGDNVRLAAFQGPLWNCQMLRGTAVVSTNSGRRTAATGRGVSPSWVFR